MSTSTKNLNITTVLFFLVILAFAAQSTNAMNPMVMNPVMLSFYRRQQCERSFEMCKLSAMGEWSVFLAIRVLQALL